MAVSDLLLTEFSKAVAPLHVMLLLSSCRVEILFNWFNPYIPNVQKVVKRTLNILPQMLQDFERMFEHFVHTKHYKG